MNHGTVPVLVLPLRRALTLLLGLAAVITGILGMHILNVSHHLPGTGAAGHTISVSAEHSPATHHALKPANNAVASIAASADGPHAAACAGPCGDHDTMTAVCMLMIVTSCFALFFMPKRIRINGLHGLRAPPQSVTEATPSIPPPSLVELSISRT